MIIGDEIVLQPPIKEKINISPKDSLLNDEVKQRNSFTKLSLFHYLEVHGMK